MVGKVRKAIYTVWGIAQRARVNRSSQRLYLMDAFVKARCFYGVEVWGWKREKEVERTQALLRWQWESAEILRVIFGGWGQIEEVGR